jgi:tetratricopeptide (TPR) repeat protein
LLEGLDADEARALFWDFASARYREPDESLAAQLVEKVGGHPLAIELLAHAFGASAESFPDFLRGFEKHLARAENLYIAAERQQTLAGCFDYSFAFLPAPAQALFPKLKLFAAPFLADAVKFIFQADDAATRVNLLRQSSFVRAYEFAEDVPLYYLHPTARWYAEEREKEIEGLREKEIGARYGEWYARIANAAYASFAGKTNLFDVALARVSVPDLMAAREWMEPEARVWHSFRIAFLFQIFGSNQEELNVLGEAEQIANEHQLHKAKSSVLFEMAYIFVTRGDLDQAMHLYRQSASIDEQLGDLQGKSATLHAMANIFVTRGDLDQAMQLYRQSLQIKEQLGDLKGKSATLHQMATVFVTRGDLDQAMHLYRQSLQIIEQLGDLKGKIRTLANMANLIENNNQLDQAFELYVAALQISQQLKDLFGIANVLAMMSAVLVKQGKMEDALKALIDSLNIAIQLQAMPLANSNAQQIVNLKQHIGAAEFAALWEQVTGNTEMPEWLKQ